MPPEPESLSWSIVELARDPVAGPLIHASKTLPFGLANRSGPLLLNRIAMDEQTAIRAIIDMVPNWYEADTGPVDYSFSSGDHAVRFWGHRRPTPWLTEFLRAVRAEIATTSEGLRPYTTAVAIDLLQEHFAERWLALVAPGIAWPILINYSRECLQRTYENDEIAFNLVIRSEGGAHPITSPSFQRIFDPLASSNRTYFQVDRDFNFVDYREILWNEIGDVQEYVFYPEFLHPFTQSLGQGEFSVHQTRRGDLVIMNSNGLLAAKRKGRWKLYDVETLKNSITEAVGQYRVGANLFEVVFDLSFRRHGALLVYDPRHLVVSNISNPQSRLDQPHASDLPRTLLSPSVRPMSFSAIERSRRKKLLLLELASVDGAVVFDDEHILAVGAMIRTHEDVPGEAGARSTAARSAYLYGGRPVKVSSDGEISIYFRSTDDEGGSSDAVLEFL